jgi:hypothetical protein
MKTNYLLITVLLLIAMFACKKEQVSQEKLPEHIKKLAEMNMKLQSIKSSDFAHVRYAPVNSYLSSVYSGNTLKSGKLEDGDSTGYLGDSTIFIGDSTFLSDSIWWNWDWESCAQITKYVDENGYYVTVMDYGEQGCEEWGSFIKGKITSKWKEDENGSYFEEIYENYNAWGMTMNGTFSSTSQGNWPWYDSTDTGNNSFEIINICTENMTISFDTGATYTYVSSFKDKYTNNQYVILEGEFEYNSSDGDNYSYRILEPVVTNFLCENSYIPVSGIEQWTESTTIYEIDYGNGNCDNKATITENGKVYEVDFDEFIDSVKVQTGDSTLVGP